MALTKCRECGEQISTTASACPQCGAKRKKTSLFVVVVGFTVIIAAVGGLLAGIGRQAKIEAELALATQQREHEALVEKQQASTFAEVRASLIPSVNQKLAAQDYAGAGADLAPFITVKDSELDALRSTIAAHEKTESDARELSTLVKRTATLSASATDEAVSVYSRLLELKPGNKEYESKLAHAQKAKESADLRKSAASAAEARRSFAQATEDKFLAAGHSVTVTTVGSSQTTLHIKFVLVSKAFAYQMQHADDFLAACRRLGFKKIVMADGYSEVWTLAL